MIIELFHTIVNKLFSKPEIEYYLQTPVYFKYPVNPIEKNP